MIGPSFAGSVRGANVLFSDIHPLASTSSSLSARPGVWNRLHESHSSKCQISSSLQDKARARLIVVRAGGDEGEDEEEEGSQRQRGRGNKGRRPPQEDEGPRKDADGFIERVLQVSRVTKVVKGGKQMSFRAVVAVGNGEGKVGVGCSSAKEVVTAVEKAVYDAKRHIISIPITRGFTFPHRANGIAGGAKVMLRPASEGTGVIAGGAVREVLELSGIKNAFGKQLGSSNPLNNARATVDGLLQMRTLSQAAKDRDITVEEMLGFTKDKAAVAA